MILFAVSEILCTVPPCGKIATLWIEKYKNGEGKNPKKGIIP